MWWSSSKACFNGSGHTYRILAHGYMHVEAWCTARCPEGGEMKWRGGVGMVLAQFGSGLYLSGTLQVLSYKFDSTAPVLKIVGQNYGNWVQYWTSTKPRLKRWLKFLISKMSNRPLRNRSSTVPYCNYNSSLSPRIKGAYLFPESLVRGLFIHSRPLTDNWTYRTG